MNAYHLLLAYDKADFESREKVKRGFYNEAIKSGEIVLCFRCKKEIKKEG